MRVKKHSFLKLLWLKFLNTPNSKLAIYACSGFLVVFASGVFTFQFAQYKLRTSEFNILALKKLAEHSKLLDLLGKPITAGYVYSRETGSITPEKVDCVVPIQGKNCDGLIKYQADKVQSEWILRKMEFTFLDEAGGVLRLVKNDKQSLNKNEEAENTDGVSENSSIV